MSTQAAFPEGKATALLAHALDVDSPHAIPRETLDALVDAVCTDAGERARLVSILASTQNQALPAVLLELLGARRDRVRDALEAAEDADTVYGTWAQRTAGGAVLAGVGFVATGVLTGGWGALALVSGLLAGGGTTYARDRLRRRARAARREVEQTERVIDLITATMPKSGAN